MRQISEIGDIEYTDISIHAPMRGATIYSHVNYIFNSNFNPRTHEGCDTNKIITKFSMLSISIHAPMRGATVVIVDDTD